jgi:hypothetical protein
MNSYSNTLQRNAAWPIKRPIHNQSIDGSNSINLRGYPSQSGLDRIETPKLTQIRVELRVKGGIEDAFVLFLVRARSIYLLFYT